MKQISDPEQLKIIINEILDNNAQSIQDFAAGKDRAVRCVQGQPYPCRQEECGVQPGTAPCRPHHHR